MPDLPKPLVRKVAAGQAVLFLGTHIPGTIEKGGLPGPEELARALAEHGGYTGSDRSLARVAQYYQVTLGRGALIDFLKKRLGDSDRKPAPLHRLVARLPLPVIITTCYDTLLERALREAHRHYRPLLKDQELPYVDESEVLLIKVLGSIEYGETLIITERELLRFMDDFPLSIAFKYHFAIRTPLLLCHNLEDLTLKQLYGKARAGLGQNAPPAYAVVPAATDDLIADWAEAGLQVIDADPLAFLEALTAAVAQEIPPPEPAVVPPPPPLTKRPFKFLNYYDTADADIFFGRERETRDLAQLALSHRLVILTGASGTGKTSLVRAGVVPALNKQDVRTVVTRVGDDPVTAVIDALCRAVPDLELPAAATLAQVVQAAEAQAKCLIVVFLDQFEEFFERLGQPTQERFVDTLAGCLDDANLGTRFVLSLRSDFFVQLQAFKSRLQGVFHNTYEVHRLTPEQARKTITEPLRAVGLGVEPEELVDVIVADLDLEGIDPPQLQIVCDRLYQKAIDTGSDALTVTLYNDLGGAERILNEYLDDVLARLPDADRVLAREVFKALVTSQDTKDQLSLEQLTRGLAAPEADVARVVDSLEEDRLLRCVEEAGVPRYELVHDHLAQRVREWLDEGERQLKAAQEMLRREMDGWRQHRLSLSRAEMRLVDGQRDRLRPSEEELVLIAYSAVLHDMSAEAWLGRTPDPTAVLLALLDDEDAVARQRAAVRLGQRGDPGVGAALAEVALADPEPTVQETAARALGSLGDSHDEAGLALLVDATRVGESRQSAVVALAHARDVGAKLPVGLGTAVRLRVMGRLAGMRVWRTRRRVLSLTLGGALGGALGLGVGFAFYALLESTSPQQLFNRLPLALLLLVLFGLFGLGAGGFLSLLAALGAVLSLRRARVLYLIGAVVGGALGHGLVFLVFFGLGLYFQPLVGFQGTLQAALTGLMLGLMVGVGITLPTWIAHRNVTQLGLSVLGGILGGGLVGLVANLMNLHPLATSPAMVKGLGTGAAAIVGAGRAATVGAVSGGGVGLGLALAGALLRRRAGLPGGETDRGGAP